jgi:hypothetical protein
MSVSRVPLSSIENKILSHKTTNDVYKLNTISTGKWSPSSTKFDELRRIIESSVSDDNAAVRANSIIDQLQFEMENQHRSNERPQSPLKNEMQIQTVLNTVEQPQSVNNDGNVNSLIWHDHSPSGHVYRAENHSNDEVIDPELSQAPESISVPELKTSVRRSNRRASISSLSILQNISKDSSVREKKPRPRTTKKAVEAEVRDDITNKDLETERPCISPNKSPKIHGTASPSRVFEDYPLPWISEEALETLPSIEEGNTIEEGDISEPLCAVIQSSSYSVLVDSPAVSISTSSLVDENKLEEVQSVSPFGLYTASMSALSISEDSTAEQFKISQIPDVNCGQNHDAASPLLNSQGDVENVNYHTMLELLTQQSSPSSSIGSLARTRDSNDDLISSGTASLTCPENPAFPSRRRGRKPKTEETSSKGSRRKSMRFAARPSRYMTEEDHFEMEVENPTVNAFFEGKAMSSDSLEGMKTRGRKDTDCKAVENVVTNNNDDALEVFGSEIDISEKPKKLKQARSKKDKAFIPDVPREDSPAPLILESTPTYPDLNTCQIDVGNTVMESPIIDKCIVDSFEQIIYTDEKATQLLDMPDSYDQGLMEVLIKEDQKLEEIVEVLGETAAVELRGSELVEDVGEGDTNLVCITISIQLSQTSVHMHIDSFLYNYFFNNDIDLD